MENDGGTVIGQTLEIDLNSPNEGGVRKDDPNANLRSFGSILS
jgi:hypothetical protein